MTMPPAKHREPIVPAKVKIAVAVMLQQSHPDVVAAAKEAGLEPRKLREYLKRAEVVRYVRAERQAFVDEVCLGNPAALARIRDTAENTMASVASIRQLEQMRQGGANEAGGLGQRVPGLQIVIMQPGHGPGDANHRAVACADDRGAARDRG
jgi:hypothetical protein